MMSKSKVMQWGLMLAAVLCGTAWAADEAPQLKPVPAAQARNAVKSTMLGTAWAGSRAVAVGDHGVVLLSDDDGKSFRQAKSVPLSSTLTSVTFVNDKTGWAVGHWGAILRTDDGGETWSVQRLVPGEDRPLFAVHFFDEQRGVAVGLWSLVLLTTDGGKSWAPQTITPPPGATKADLNLLSLFADGRGRVYAPAERGMVLYSDDKGRTWNYISTGYTGSLWAGIALPDGTLLVGGLRGSIYRSSDGGRQWERIDGGSKSSITGFVTHPAGVLAYGLDGAQLLSKDAGRSFRPAEQAQQGISLTTALPRKSGEPILFSRAGVVLVSSH